MTLKLPIIGTIDERFLMHRLRSTSIAGLTAVVVTGGFFIHSLWANRVIRWDLFAIIATAAVVKLAVLTWYRFND
jgi:hypothetical protein